MKLTIENADINNVDEVLYAYIFQHTKQYEYYLIKCHFILVFKDNHYSTYVKSNLFDNKTMITWKNFVEKAIDDFKNKEYNFNHIVETNIITIANELDMAYNFYTKHNMQAFECKLNAMINRNKSLISKFNRNWRHPLNRNIESYRV